MRRVLRFHDIHLFNKIHGLEFTLTLSLAILLRHP